MRTLFLSLLLLLPPCLLRAQALQAGFDTAEYAELMRVSARTAADTGYAGKIPAPQRFRMVYRSAVVGLDNQWDLWTDGWGTALISIRGTTRKDISWLENFYAAMVPATGRVQVPGQQPFDYRLAADERATVHAGWLIGLAAMAPDMLRHIDSLQRAGVQHLLIMGHSQGGALAYLLTAYLRHLQVQGRLGTPLRIKTYCSAAPKPGNLAFAYDYEAMSAGGWSFTVVNSADWVPETPVSIQTLADFNPLNPFVNAAKGIRKQRFPANIALLHVYRRLYKVPRKAERTYRRYLGTVVGKRVGKLLPGLQLPPYKETAGYARAGVPVVLLADSAYYQRYAPQSENVFTHHLHAPYLYLLERLHTGKQTEARQPAGQ